MIRKSLACGAVVLAGLLAGCGSKAEEGEKEAFRAPERIEACSLFPFQEAQEIAGAAVATISSTLDDAVGADTKKCAYNAGSIEQPQILGIEIRPTRTVREAVRRQEASRSYLGTLAKGDLQDVQGVGDAAFWAGGSVKQLQKILWPLPGRSPNGPSQGCSKRTSGIPTPGGAEIRCLAITRCEEKP
jgi:hypothetical protein